MAKVPINDPKHWRDRAEEARTVADQMDDPDSKRKMLRIAKDYEELARRAEKRLNQQGQKVQTNTRPGTGPRANRRRGLRRASLAPGFRIPAD